MITAAIPAPVLPASLCCIACRTALPHPQRAGVSCPVCQRNYPVRDGLWIAQGELTGKNRIAADFYNSERWLRFQPWERLFLRTFGGLRGARFQVLRRLTLESGDSLLEVGIGDGENVRLLPAGWKITGVDIAERPLAACRTRYPERKLFLALAEGEHLPFAAGSFDGVLCVGGFNFFSDPLQALREMARVTRPGGPIVVADELPELYEWGWGHLLGCPRFDTWLMERFWLGPEFTAMVMSSQLDVDALARAVFPAYRVHTIWRGLGYCLAARSPG